MRANAYECSSCARPCLQNTLSLHSILWDRPIVLLILRTGKLSQRVVTFLKVTQLVRSGAGIWFGDSGSRACTPNYNPVWPLPPRHWVQFFPFGLVLWCMGWDTIVSSQESKIELIISFIVYMVFLHTWSHFILLIICERGKIGFTLKPSLRHILLCDIRQVTQLLWESVSFILAPPCRSICYFYLHFWNSEKNKFTSLHSYPGGTLKPWGSRLVRIAFFQTMAAIL